MLTNADICSRIRELKEARSAEVIALEISSRNSRIRALQKRWDRLRSRLDMILDQRGADMADIPGGSTGLLLREYKGKKADRLVTRIDPAIISLFAELLRHERQAAHELGQWKTGVASPKPPHAPSATFALASICTPEQLAEMKRRALALQREWDSRCQREGGQATDLYSLFSLSPPGEAGTDPERAGPLEDQPKDLIINVPPDFS
jgi:hypothetical protein